MGKYLFFSIHTTRKKQIKIEGKVRVEEIIIYFLLYYFMLFVLFVKCSFAGFIEESFLTLRDWLKFTFCAYLSTSRFLLKYFKRSSKDKSRSKPTQIREIYALTSDEISENHLVCYVEKIFNQFSNFCINSLNECPEFNETAYFKNFHKSHFKDTPKVIIKSSCNEMIAQQR